MLLCAPGRNETAACAWVGCQTRWGAGKPSQQRIVCLTPLLIEPGAMTRLVWCSARQLQPIRCPLVAQLGLEGK